MLFAFNSLVTAFANILIGIFVYTRNPKQSTNRLFFLLTLTLGLWIVTLYYYYVTTDVHLLLFLGRINFAFPTLTIYYLYRFIYEFPSTTIKLSKVLRFLITLLAYTMTFLAAFTPFIDKNEILLGTERIIEYGQMYNLWVAYFAGLPVFALSLLMLKIHNSKGISKKQLRYLLAGTGLAYFFGLVTNVILPSFFGIFHLQQVGPIGTLFLTSFTAYAIARHKFLDITAVVARAVSFTLLLTLVVIFEVLIFWIGTSILPINIDRSLIALGGSIIIIMSYSSIRSVITQLTERVFFQGRYDAEDLIKTLTSIMASEMNVKFLELKLTKMLCQEMKLSSASFLLVTDFVAKKTPVLDEANIPSLKFANLEKMLHTVKKTMIFEELTDEADKELFRKLEISLVLPLIVGDEDIGLLILGPKLSGDIYGDRDIEVLEIFAPQAAIALKNADSYRQIQEFNQTLELKVIDRTHELELAQQEQLKLKDEFVFIATHDLATPVTAISGFSALIKAKGDKLPKEIQSDLSAIDEASNRLKTLVNDLLQVARSDSGTIKVNLVKVEAKEILESAARQIGPLAKEKNVTVTLKLGTQNTISADPVKLAEVFENLLSNAVKYNKDGGSVTVTSSSLYDKIIFEFKDTGVGIGENETSKVFTKFFRSETPEVRQRPGTGLGLFVVRMLVEKMGGKISFESIKDVGSTFTLQFNS